MSKLVNCFYLVQQIQRSHELEDGLWQQPTKILQSSQFSCVLTVIFPELLAMQQLICFGKKGSLIDIHSKLCPSVKPYVQNCMEIQIDAKIKATNKE